MAKVDNVKLEIVRVGQDLILIENGIVLGCWYVNAFGRIPDEARKIVARALGEDECDF